MFRTVRRFGILLLVLFCVAPVAACAASGGTPAPGQTAIVIAAHTSAPRITPADIEPALAMLDAEGDRVTVIVADGAPQVIYDSTVGDLSDYSEDREDELSRARTQVAERIVSAIAQTPEVDLTEAIALAAETFDGAGPYALVVLAPGLSTTGAFSMLDGRLYAEPADLVANVRDQGGLPDLRDVIVRMPRLGVTVAPQPDLTADARTSLTGLWAAYFSATGATDVKLGGGSLNALAQNSESLPPVTPVPIERPLPVAEGGCRQVLADASIGFAAASAHLVDTAATEARIADIVASLADCGGTYLVEGSASSEGGEAFNTTIAEARAQTVAAEVARIAGIDLADIEVKGWGTAWPCRVDDVDDAGRLIVDAASANRVVVVSRGATSTC